MVDITATRPGQADGAGDADALFLKKFSGECIVAFDEANVMASRHMVRTISEGKSAQFPAFGKTLAGYHTPGAELNGDTILMNEKVITVDGLLLAHTYVASIDELKKHFDIRGPFAKELGSALAREYDKRLFRVGVAASAASATITGSTPALFGGYSQTNASAKTNGATLAGLIFNCAQNFDEKDVPADGRSAYILPAQYYLLAQTTALLNKDIGGSGAYQDGTILRIGGIELVKTNNLPQAAVTGEPQSVYNYNPTTPSGLAALVMHNTCLGTVKLLDVNTVTWKDERRRATLMIAEYAMGHNFLRPEAAAKIITQA